MACKGLTLTARRWLTVLSVILSWCMGQPRWIKTGEICSSDTRASYAVVDQHGYAMSGGNLESPGSHCCGQVASAHELMQGNLQDVEGVCSRGKNDISSLHRTELDITCSGLLYCNCLRGG